MALSSGVLWGVWGFGYGRYGRVMSRYSVLLFSASGAALTFLVAGLVRHDMRIDSIDVRDGLLGGFLNLLGSVLLLKALTMGNWSRLSSFLNQPGRHCAPRVSVSEREMELSLAMMPSVVAINDVVLDVVFTTQETTEMEMPNIVWSVGGTAAGSRAVEATVSGIEICQSWKQATGTDASFGRAVTGPFGALGWLSGYADMGEFDAAWRASSANENWISTMSGSQENFGQDFGSATSTVYRKL